MPTNTKTTPERDGGYTAEEIMRDVRFGYAMLARIKEMSGDGSCEAHTMRRILALAERVANAPTTTARANSVFDCRDATTTEWTTFGSIDGHYEWDGKQVALVLLTPERGSSGGDL